MRMMALLLVLVGHGLGCGGPQKNKINTDTEVLPYVAPDVEEIAGTDMDEEEDTDEGEETPAPEPTPTPAPAPAQNPQK
jgi:hypothetical protein